MDLNGAPALPLRLAGIFRTQKYRGGLLEAGLSLEKKDTSIPLCRTETQNSIESSNRAVVLSDNEAVGDLTRNAGFLTRLFLAVL
jgi:hypothetical protein